MLWHIVRFDFAGLDDALREELEDELRALADLDVVRGLRVARDVEEPTVTGLLVALDDDAALDAYRQHPDHLPLVHRIRELQVPAARLDVRTDDDPSLLA